MFMVKIEEKMQVKFLQIQRVITNTKGGSNTTLQSRESVIYSERVHISTSNLKKKKKKKEKKKKKKKK